MLDPNEGVLPYDLNTPLFSDYAFKYRFVWIAPGESATYNDAESFDFPVGSVIVKTFAYPFDFRDPESGERLVETRLMMHKTQGWVPATYMWNDEQTEAKLLQTGATVPVSWVDLDGAMRSIGYHIPNANQCKECHNEHDNVTGPLGPKARNLNKDYPYSDGTENQLTRWSEMGYLSGAPVDPADAPRNAVFDDPTTGSLEERARSYVDVNCGNCHNASGLARTSGLFLTIHETNPTALGICKSPVAAGQGSGNLSYDIVPGQPDESIVVYRMQSTVPGVAMPELGRQTTHEEALAVVRDWIASLPGSCD